jgi:diguanylate cyclase (GGDEF)-like protein
MPTRHDKNCLIFTEPGKRGETTTGKVSSVFDCIHLFFGCPAVRLEGRKRPLRQLFSWIFVRLESMHLDANTLFLVTINVEAVLGLLLLFAWIQNARARALAWWGCAHLLRANAVALYGMRGTVPDIVAGDIAIAILLTTFAIIWTGARVFSGRPPRMLYLFAGAAVWLLLCRIPSFAEWSDGRLLASSAIIAAYLGLAAHELWRGRAERLVSRSPAILILSALSALFLLRTPLGAVLPWLPVNPLADSVWSTMFSFEALLFTLALAFLLLAMAKERTEARHKTAALLDPLTGVTNRRVFLQAAARLAARQLADPRPVAVLIFDIDHVRSINDRFGDALGDRVLQIFARIARANLTPTDLIGRIDGEEFAAVLVGADNERAVSVAERIRFGFADAARCIEAELVGATATVGIVTAANGALEIAPLLAQADKALARAKARGGNRAQVEEFVPTAKHGAAVTQVQTAA